MASGGYTNTSISFTASDTGSGVAGMYVKIPDSSGYIAYAAGTPFYGEGAYYVYATDAAGNESGTVTVTLDTTNPIGTINSNGVTVPNNGYTNEAFSYAAADSVSGVSEHEVKYPNGTWEPYMAGAEIPANVGGVYAFRAIDKAGNVSDESRVCLITVTPGVILYADEQPANSGTYTNAARIGMSAVGEYVKACYVKLPGASDFVPYTQYLTYTVAGRYEFYAEDYAGGKTETAVIIVDRGTKPVMINSMSDSKADGNVTLTWTDGDTLTVAPIVTVTVNGVSYQKGNAIRTIDGGAYRVESIDAAGNIWTDMFTANRKEILSDTLNKQYFESIGDDENRYAFDSYDNALVFSKARESALVRTGTWSSETWDGGIPMDSIDSANARNGEYYIYVRPDRA